MRIDFRFKKQYLHGFYIWKCKNYVAFGKNGTSYHFALNKKDFADLEDLKIEILKTIRRLKDERY